MSEPGADDWPRLLDLFDRLVDVEPAQRAQRLDELTTNEPELRAHLERLLAFDAGEDHLRTGVASARVQLFDEDAAPPESLGPWRIVRTLGAGGMGRVYFAERTDEGFEQRAALKVIRGEFTSDAAIARFMAERRILARLDHPGIASLVDGGVDPHGRPWFAMQYVDGLLLPDYFVAHALGLEDRIRLFIAVCDAVAYAHRQLVVHCDLKPSNVMVDAGGQPRLLDFGVARLLEPGAGGRAAQTQVQALTPGYAAPEQVLGGTLGVATDVYGLGAILYELLSGRRPHADVDDTPAALAAAITGGEPMPVSRAVADTSPVPARRLRGDLDLITATALRHDSAQRYPGADALADDLHRHLDGLPLRAHRGRAGVRLRKFLRRHWLPVAATSIVMLALAGALIVSRVQIRAAHEANARSQAVQKFLLGVFDAAHPYGGGYGVLTQRQLADRAAADLDRLLSAEPEARIDALISIGTVYQKLGMADRARPMFESALKALELEEFASTDNRTVRTLTALGQVDFEHGDYKSATAHLELAEALAKAQGSPAPVHATIQFELGASYSALLRPQPALSALDQAERAAVVGDPDLVARIQTERAVLFERMNRFEDAIAAATRGVDSARERHGQDSPETIHALSTLGESLEFGGQFDRAESVIRGVLASQQHVYGQSQSETVNHLANVLHDRGRFAAAEAQSELALQLAEARYGQGSEKAAQYRRDLALNQIDNGRLDEAKANLEAAHDIFVKKHAIPILAFCTRADLAHVDMLSGRGSMAEKEITDIISTAPSNGGVCGLWRAHVDRARLSLDSGDVVIARKEIAAAQATAEAKELDPPSRVEVDLLDGDIARAQHDHAAAERAYRAAVDVAVHTFDAGNPLTLAAKARLASVTRTMAHGGNP